MSKHKPRKMGKLIDWFLRLPVPFHDPCCPPLTPTKVAQSEPWQRVDYVADAMEKNKAEGKP